MIDEEYVTPEVLRELFVKDKGKTYRLKDIPLYKYYLNGCLGHKAEDRLKIGVMLFSDFEKSGLRKSGIIDPSKPKVDCSFYQNMTPSQYFHLDRLNKALKTIKEMDICRLVFDVVLLEIDKHMKNANKDWKARKYNNELNKKLCSGLDNITEFYIGRRFIKHKIVGFSKARIM